MTSNKPNHEDEQLFDMLNLSPPSLMNKYPGSDFQSYAPDYNGQSPNTSFPPGQSPMADFPGQSPNSKSFPVQSPTSNFFSDRTPNSIFDFNVPNELVYDTQQPDDGFQKNANVNLSNNSGMSLTTSNLYQASNDLLAPNTFLQPHPRSPSAVSSHSLYSEVSSNPGSPFTDALSHFSNNAAYSDVGNNISNSFTNNPSTNFSSLNVPNAFDSEIALGGSISSTNLLSLNNSNPPPQFNFSVTDDTSAPPYNSSVINSQLNNELNKLTRNNLNNYINNIQPNENFQQNSYLGQQPSNGDVTINIDRAPEEVAAARTPSLFSNSSHNSSVENSPHRPPSYNKSGRLSPGANGGSSLMPNSQFPPSSPGSVVSDVSENHQNSLLKPEEFQSIKRGRKKAHSDKVRHRSTLRSSAISDDMSDEDGVSSGYDDDDEKKGGSTGLSSREKMLELASPNQSSKRTQKHPSVYACHLCEKRFTRPYNLKSHLRTHTDERPFICNVCGKAFARQHDRKRHEDLHTGEKKFQCKGLLKNGTPYGCGRKFARADALRRHFQTEAGKECIRLLVEEDKTEKIKNGTFQLGEYDISNIGMAGIIMTSTNETDTTSSDLLSPNGNIPQLAISPPE